MNLLNPYLSSIKPTKIGKIELGKLKKPKKQPYSKLEKLNEEFKNDF